MARHALCGRIESPGRELQAVSWAPQSVQLQPLSGQISLLLEISTNRIEKSYSSSSVGTAGRGSVLGRMDHSTIIQQSRAKSYAKGLVAFLQQNMRKTKLKPYT